MSGSESDTADPGERPTVPGAAAVTWLGHATTIIEIDGVRLLTDPLLRDRIGPLGRIGPPVDAPAVESVHGVLLSHLHSDHADLPSLRLIAASRPVFAPQGAGAWLRRNGIGDVRELRVGEEGSLGGVRVVATGATHDPRRYRHFGPTADPLGFAVRGSAAVYFAGDTDLFPEMSELAGAIDIALLPIAGWGPSVGAGHLDPERAAMAAALIAPRLVIPIHWGTLALPRWARRGRDPAQPARDFEALAARHAPGIAVRVLGPGQRIELGADERPAAPSPP